MEATNDNRATTSTRDAGTDTIEVVFLCQECQTVVDVANRLAAYFSLAQKTLDISIYSFNLCSDEARDIVLNALRERARAGVAIRIAYDAGSEKSQIPNVYNDPCDLGTPGFISSLDFRSKAIEGYQALMHDKYVIVDHGTPNSRVWTGSTNWTDDSWRLEENNIVIVHSQEIADYFTNDFEELWVDANIATSGQMDETEVTLQYAGQPARVRVMFSPFQGEVIDETLAGLIENTREKLTLASVVVTSGKILDALLKLMERGVTIEGMYDATQMEGVKHQWQMVPANHWKIPAWEQIASRNNLVGKNSIPYTPTSTHDYMHNKVLVSDNTVVTGSYNFSRHAQRNAENILIIESSPLADTYRQYIGKMMDRYRQPRTNPPIPPQEEPEQQSPNI